MGDSASDIRAQLDLELTQQHVGVAVKLVNPKEGISSQRSLSNDKVEPFGIHFVLEFVCSSQSDASFRPQRIAWIPFFSTREFESKHDNVYREVPTCLLLWPISKERNQVRMVSHQLVVVFHQLSHDLPSIREFLCRDPLSIQCVKV
jgi:hypothetical protein